MFRRLEMPLVLAIAGVITFEVGFYLLPISSGTVRGIVAFVMLLGGVSWFVGKWLIVFNLVPRGRKEKARGGKGL